MSKVTSTKYLAEFTLWSPDQTWQARFQGLEVGMGAPCSGQVSLKDRTGRRVYTAPSWAEACFSDDSQYFIHRKASTQGNRGYAVTVVVHCESGREEWVEELSMGQLVELRNSEFDIQVNGKPLKSLQEISFDISRSELEVSA